MKQNFLFFCVIVCVYTCSSNDNIQETTQPDSNFYALNVGNSWVYKYYKLDITDNSYSFNNVIDSVSIVGTETINDKLYYKFKTITSGNIPTNGNPGFSNGERFDFFRDSLGYLVNDLGVRLFSNQNTDEWIYLQTPLTYHFKLTENIETINTNAGLFECSDVRVKHFINGNEAPCINHRYYSDGIGEVMLTFCYVATEEHEWLKKLDSYIIQ